jgi:hypothetical protein
MRKNQLRLAGLIKSEDCEDRPEDSFSIHDEKPVGQRQFSIVPYFQQPKKREAQARQRAA